MDQLEFLSQRLSTATSTENKADTLFLLQAVS